LARGSGCSHTLFSFAVIRPRIIKALHVLICILNERRVNQAGIKASLPSAAPPLQLAGPLGRETKGRAATAVKFNPALANGTFRRAGVEGVGGSEISPPSFGRVPS
jgi:hypothetical protein